MLCWMAASQFFLCLCEEGGEHKEDAVKVVKVVKVGESKVGTRLAATGLRDSLQITCCLEGGYHLPGGLQKGITPGLPQAFNLDAPGQRTGLA